MFEEDSGEGGREGLRGGGGKINESGRGEKKEKKRNRRNEEEAKVQLQSAGEARKSYILIDLLRV